MVVLIKFNDTYACVAASSSNTGVDMIGFLLQKVFQIVEIVKQSMNKIEKELNLYTTDNYRLVLQVFKCYTSIRIL